MEQLLTVQEIADLFKVPPSWIYDRTRRRGPERIPHVKLGRYVRFRKEEVEGFIEDHRGRK
ncbi:MAG: helix-turn-helix domain-containing protein [Candidatus Eisenbacteria sp.]|nr:helix-turn-helix domain-containing protein [Candidatus Eisenbacteria bacterium]